MAGAGWKEYSTGDLISATEFQTFVQDQVIQVYNNASARDTALGTNDAEGMFCFLKDNSAGSDGSGTSELQFYNGSAWVAFVGDGDITESQLQLMQQMVYLVVQVLLLEHFLLL